MTVPRKTKTSVEPWPAVTEDASNWPAAADGCVHADFDKALCEAKLEVRKKRVDEAIARAKGERDADLAIEQEYYKAIFEVEKGSLDRVRASADTVQKAAAAIVTLYTGILALAFSVAERPLPLRAIFAALLLGAAVTLSTAFLAYLPSPDSGVRQRRDERGSNGHSVGERVVSGFDEWIRSGALRNSRILRASVVALGLSLAFLPAPFVAFEREEGKASAPPWGAAPPARTSDIELQKILYTAQVAEIAEQRKQPLADDKYRSVWWLLFGGAVLIVLAVWKPWEPSTVGPTVETTSGTSTGTAPGSQ